MADPVGGPSRPPVSADDVLDMHGLLASFQGDAAALLARMDGGPRA